MTRFLTTLLFLATCLSALQSEDFDSTKNLPIAFQARFRSLDSAARLWMHEFYHKHQLKKDDLPLFHVDSTSALNLLWMYHLQGHSSFDKAPFFWIHYSATKQLLGTNLKDERFSYDTLFKSLYQEKETNLQVMKLLITQEFLERTDGSPNKIELSSLTPGLWVGIKNGALIVLAAPKNPPWHFLTPQMSIIENIANAIPHQKAISEELITLLQAIKNYVSGDGTIEEDNLLVETTVKEQLHAGLSPNKIENVLNEKFPLSTRLQRAGTSLKMLPTRHSGGEWISLHALAINVYDAKKQRLVPIENFTIFANEHFQTLRDAYINLKTTPTQMKIEAFTNAYDSAYRELSGKPYRAANGKHLSYPSHMQLSLETIYYRLPLTATITTFYSLAILLLIAATPLKNHYCGHLAFGFACVGFVLHTLLLGIRCYILERPPVSNMFETVVYVPWVTMLIGLTMFYKNRLVLAAGCIASIALLLLLQITYDDARLENVQAVLDSQYWLLIHVLMVVGSYGAFILCGILGHFYLFSTATATSPLQNSHIAKSILYTMYVGIALLIPGTILGGVWAAESWGRFWDWDPKESWAFISACVYLLVLHAYTFKRIGDLGLALGSIAGLMAISFTWYGVNYILGTGLHSYGFGKGGEKYYFGYLLIELIFIISALMAKSQREWNRKTS